MVRKIFREFADALPVHIVIYTVFLVVCLLTGMPGSEIPWTLFCYVVGALLGSWVVVLRKEDG